MADALMHLLGPLIALSLLLVVYLHRTQRAPGQGPLPEQALPNELPLRVPRINEDLCIGCEKCVAICPTEVLGLAEHKSKVVNEESCISCQKCAAVCPTQALVMYQGGTEPTTNLLLPNLDEYYQSIKVPGLYLIGEAAGKPLVKNAVNLGRAAVEHLRLRGGLVPLARRPLSPARADVVDVDVAIIGAGPAGLSAALTCLHHGLSYVLFERTNSSMSTVMRYPKNKDVQAEPRDVRCVGFLPVWDCKTPELQEEWNRIIAETHLDIALETAVDDVQFDAASASFLVTTRDMEKNVRGALYRAQRVIIAIGGVGIPRKMGGTREKPDFLPGENLPHVRKVLDDAERYKKMNILVVGGGDSAIESAVDLAQPSHDNRVLLAYRNKESNLSCNPTNLKKFRAAVADKRILPIYEAEPESFVPNGAVLKIADPGRKPPKRRRELPTDFVFALIGGDPAKKWLEQIQIDYTEFGHQEFRRPATDKLVEALVGPQPSYDQPGPAPLAADRTIVDSRPPDFLAAAGMTLRPDRRALSNAIKTPRDTQRLRLPEKARIEGPMMTIGQARSMMTLGQARPTMTLGQARPTMTLGQTLIGTKKPE